MHQINLISKRNHLDLFQLMAIKEIVLSWNIPLKQMKTKTPEEHYKLY